MLEYLKNHPNEKGMTMTLRDQALIIKKASISYARATTEEKNQALLAMADALEVHRQEILAANEKDVVGARDAGMRESLVDRLCLTPSRFEGMKDALRQVARQEDPIGSVIRHWTNRDGLDIRQVRVPLGVIAIIYESRPNVTVETASLALKSGNGIFLRGSSSALRSNVALVDALREGLSRAGIDPHIIDLVRDADRSAVDELIHLRGIIDLVIPRGGAGLIQHVVQNASVPVVETGVGNNHIFVDATADLDMAVTVVDNAKTSRPGTCNAVETLLVHREIASAFLPKLAQALEGRCELRGDDEVARIISVTPLQEDDFATEFLDDILAIGLVSSLNEALAHIARYGTTHSEAILTQDEDHARRFQQEVDAAAVYVNASTRFTDGGVFGFGGEMGIATQKMHARGPMGLEALTSYKYEINGNGQCRR